MKLLHRLILFNFLLCFPCLYGKINYNTVTVKMTRATQFVPKIVNKVCYLIADEGPCRANIQMYHFKPEIMNCTKFTWGGCQGNGNRFDTHQECMDTCLSQVGARPGRPTYCSLRFDYGFCFGELRRWYYDAKWSVCRETLYSGCGGNQNNFYTEEGCDSICRFGLGPPREFGHEPNKNKILIVNPLDATTRQTQGGGRSTTPTFDPVANATIDTGNYMEGEGEGD